MTVLARDALVLAQASEGPTLRAEVVRGLGAAEAIWRTLESDPAAIGTPYQRFDWVAAYAAGPMAAREVEPLVVILKGAGSRARGLLPLAVERRCGVRVARFVGGRHANFHLPLATGPLDGIALRHALRQTGREEGIDLFAFSLQPGHWEGHANPLVERGVPSPSDAYGMLLDGDPEATVRRVFSADARKKLRSKERRLVEQVGPLAHRVAASEAEVDLILDAFHALKGARFAALGIADPFAAPGARSFLREACLAGLGDGRPAVELHALVAETSGRVVAVYAGAVDATRFSGMVNAFDPDPEVARASPGDQLLLRLVADQAAKGRRALDLGVGEARYKASFCAVTIPLFESWVPVSAAGHAVAAFARAKASLRRRIKRDPRAMALVAGLRRLAAR